MPTPMILIVHFCRWCCAPSGMSSFYLWVQALQPDTGILRGKLPVYCLLSQISFLVPGGAFLSERFHIRDTAVQALLRQRREFTFRFFRSRAASSPSSTNRCRILTTVFG